MLQWNRYADLGKAISTMGRSNFLPKIKYNGFLSVFVPTPKELVAGFNVDSLIFCQFILFHQIAGDERWGVVTWRNHKLPSPTQINCQSIHPSIHPCIHACRLIRHSAEMA
jgi:hypothetical protein